MDFKENRQNFKFSSKILGVSDFDGVFGKVNDYYTIHRKFQVHSSNIFVLGATANIARWQPPPLPLTLTAYATPTPTPG